MPKNTSREGARKSEAWSRVLNWNIECSKAGHDIEISISAQDLLTDIFFSIINHRVIAPDSIHSIRRKHVNEAKKIAKSWLDDCEIFHYQVKTDFFAMDLLIESLSEVVVQMDYDNSKSYDEEDI